MSLRDFLPLDVTSNGEPRGTRTKLTWRCDTCGAEFDHFTYGGPCPGAQAQGCSGELHRKRTFPIGARVQPKPGDFVR